VTDNINTKVFLDSTLVDVLVSYIGVLDKRIEALPKPGQVLDSSLVDGLVNDLCWQIEKSRDFAATRMQNLSTSVLDKFAYALAAYTDECIILALQERLPSSSHGAVEKMLFGTSNAGEQLFARIKTLLGKRIDREVTLAAVYLMLIVLGFRGKYFLAESGEELDSLYQDLAIFSLAPVGSVNQASSKSGLIESSPILSSHLRSRHLLYIWISTIFVVSVSVLYAELSWWDTTSNLRHALSDVSNEIKSSKSLLRVSVKPSFESEYESDRQTPYYSKLPIEDRKLPLLESGLLTESINSFPELSHKAIFNKSPSLYTNYLERWSDSWSHQDIDAYLSFYSLDFVPENGENRSVWELGRRHRLKKNYLFKVSTKVLSVLSDSNNVIIEFEQTYKSSRLNSVSKKSITLVQAIGGWKIIRERVISESPVDSRSDVVRLPKPEGTR
jgi:type IV/VI secretion system ImpK/VasF family protein